jgi:hypothetical protein
MLIYGRRLEMTKSLGDDGGFLCAGGGGGKMSQPLQMFLRVAGVIKPMTSV